MRKVFLILYLTTSFACNADQTHSLKMQVPTGWKLLLQANGDLNQDHLQDSVMVVELDDPKNRKVNDGMGSKLLNLNPRRLIVLLNTGDSYKKIADVKSFIPSENSAENSCLGDVLENGGIEIKRGLLQIKFQYWQSCGGWGASNSTFSFRYESGRFRLVGFDDSYYARNSGEANTTSINYLTGKMKLTSGPNMFDETSEPSIIWKNITGKKKFYLDTMSSECERLEDTTNHWCKK